MAYFPTGIYTPRTIQNRNGVTYDASKTKVLFAEDLNVINEEIVAIEQYLNNPTSPPSGAVTELRGEVLTGSINGSNTVFSSAYTPIAGLYTIFKNGLRMKEGSDYTRSGKNFTFVAPPIDEAERPIIDYKFIQP